MSVGLLCFIFFPLRFYQWAICTILTFVTRLISPLRTNLSSFTGMHMARGSPAASSAKVGAWEGLVLSWVRLGPDQCCQIPPRLNFFEILTLWA